MKECNFYNYYFAGWFFISIFAQKPINLNNFHYEEIFTFYNGFSSRNDGQRSNQYA